MIRAMEFEHLPPHIQEALQAIADGATADSVESEVLEFKEDPSHNPKSKNPAASLYEKLIDESICFANSDGATGHIIVGVADKTHGQDAFTGTDFDAEKTARKIFEGTQPKLRVEVSEFFFLNKRLLLIFVPEALTLYTRNNGKASKRVGKSCEPIQEPERQAIVATRANPDYSNRTAARTVDEIRLDTLNEARRLLREKRKYGADDPSIPDTTQGLLRELGLVTPEGLLKKAGEILLLPAEKPQITVRYLWRSFPGVEAKATELSGALIEILPRLRNLIQENGSQELERFSREDGNEVVISRFPMIALDEVISNAVIHRDWRVSNPVIIEQSPKVLKVWSPGGLPNGVDSAHLLTTQSIPRNNRLMAAMRALGLAEEQSRGFDRMWVAFLKTGRAVPEVKTGENFVEVTLSAGEPDLEFVKALHTLENALAATKSERNAIQSLNALIVLWHLWSSPILTLPKLKELAQLSNAEALELMEYLSAIGVTHRVRDAHEWTLADNARKAMGKTSGHDIAAVTITEWLETKLGEGIAISAAEAAEELGVDRKEITDHLRHLRTLGRAAIDPAGPQRGTNARWIGADHVASES